MNRVKAWVLKAWANTFVKELILSVLGACAIQLAFGLNDLVGFVKLSKDWSELIGSGSAWGAAMSFRLVQTAVTQAAVYVMTKLGGEA